MDNGCMDDIYLQRCGGISPVKATPDMTQPVGQKNGQLFTKPGGGDVESVNGKTGVVELTGDDIESVPGETINDVLNEKADANALATVATSGSYNDLLNKPSIPDASLFVKKLAGTQEIEAQESSSPDVHLKLRAHNTDGPDSYINIGGGDDDPNITIYSEDVVDITSNGGDGTLIDGKHVVALEQGVSHAGKFLAVGEDGNVTLVEPPSGGYGWPDGYTHSITNISSESGENV